MYLQGIKVGTVERASGYRVIHAQGTATVVLFDSIVLSSYSVLLVKIVIRFALQMKRKQSINYGQDTVPCSSVCFYLSLR
ncbi:hypothetical protein HanIR_Chr10g0468951 [Helianthus annuus]|nr:hypothetical protein HanIR_Chr10g0468951 [Helianthus annuus]